MKQILLQHLELWKACGVSEIYIKQPRKVTIEKDSKALLSKAERLALCQKEYSNCKLCPLWQNRKKFVYGVGNPDAICMVIGEAPGEQENQQGIPFVGAAGQLLDKMLAAIHIQRSEVYIANIVKCRPPQNRDPEQSERISCLPYLLEQIDIIQPKIFLFLGLVAAQTLLENKERMLDLRMKVHEFRGRPVYVTYHPSSLLRNPNNKRPAWEDLQKFQIAYEHLKKETTR